MGERRVWRIVGRRSVVHLDRAILWCLESVRMAAGGIPGATRMLEGMELADMAESVRTTAGTAHGR